MAAVGQPGNRLKPGLQHALLDKPAVAPKTLAHRPAVAAVGQPGNRLKPGLQHALLDKPAVAPKTLTRRPAVAAVGRPGNRLKPGLQHALLDKPAVAPKRLARASSGSRWPSRKPAEAGDSNTRCWTSPQWHLRHCGAGQQWQPLGSQETG